MNMKAAWKAVFSEYTPALETTGRRPAKAYELRDERSGKGDAPADSAVCR